MARALRVDERQADLFGTPEPAPPARKPRRARKPPADPPPVEPETPAAWAERAGEADLDELVAALPDDALGYLALASTRQLKRRLARTRQGPRSGRKRPGTLDRASARLAAEWAAQAEEDVW